MVVPTYGSTGAEGGGIDFGRASPLEAGSCVDACWVIAIAPPAIDTGVGWIRSLSGAERGARSPGRGGWPKLPGPRPDFGSVGFMSLPASAIFALQGRPRIRLALAKDPSNHRPSRQRPGRLPVGPFLPSKSRAEAPQSRNRGKK